MYGKYPFDQSSKCNLFTFQSHTHERTRAPARARMRGVISVDKQRQIRARSARLHPVNQFGGVVVWCGTRYVIVKHRQLVRVRACIGDRV